ncbi:MAG: ChaN family lipoprotein [Kofleriaceae bacterium]
MTPTSAAAAFALALAACGGQFRAAAPTAPPAAEEPPPLAVADAGLPVSMLDARTGTQLEVEAAWSRLAAARAVCVGEEHPDPHHHWAQREIVTELARRATARGTPMALGFEMFQRPFQGVLDDFAAGRIDEAALRSRTAWDDRWGYDFALYRPAIEAARAAGAALLALNTERELTKQITRGGVDGLTPAQRATLPELVLDDPRHRAWWDAIMAEMASGHGHGHGHGQAEGHAAPADGPIDPDVPPADPIYTAQVLWDETMADGGARWLAAHPDGQLVILAGTGHCHDSAVVGRLARRIDAEVLSVRPVVDDGDGAVARALVERANDVLWVMTRRDDGPADGAP